MACLDHLQCSLHWHRHRFPFRPAVKVGIFIDITPPLGGDIDIQEDGLHRTHESALLAGDADRWIDVVLVFSRGGMDAIDGANLKACTVFDANAWLSDDVGGKL
jgi:hypothetical protein